MVSIRIRTGIVIALLGCGSQGFAQTELELHSISFDPHPIRSDDPLLDSLIEGNVGDAVALDEWESEEEAREDRLVDAITVRRGSINETEALEGEASPNLVPDLVALGSLHQELGEHLAAIEALERALHIIRVHYGLFVLDQADIIRQLNDSIAAIGQYDEAAALHRDVLELTSRNLDDPRTAFIYKDIADRQMSSFHVLLGEEYADFSLLQRDPSNSLLEVHARDGRSLALQALRGARRSYVDAIRASLGNGAFDVPGLIELQENIIETYYLEVTRPELRPFGPGFRVPDLSIYYPGASLLSAKVKSSRVSVGPEAFALAMVELADWHLRFSMNGKALATYQAAYDYLVGQGAPPETIDAIFSPAVPVSVPVVERDPDSGYRGYFDVALEVGKYGTTGDLQILDGYPRASRAIERRLKRHVAQSRFRPPFVDGEPAQSYRFSLRYYYSY